MNSKQIAISTLSMIVKIVALIVILTFVMKYAKQAYDFGYRIFTEAPVAEGEGILYTVNVENGAGPKEIAKQLEEFGLIRDQKLFYVQYLLSDYKDKIQPGSYTLSTAMTAEQMMQIMAKDAVEEPEIDEDHPINEDVYGNLPNESDEAAGDGTYETETTTEEEVGE